MSGVGGCRRPGCRCLSASLIISVTIVVTVAGSTAVVVLYMFVVVGRVPVSFRVAVVAACVAVVVVVVCKRSSRIAHIVALGPAARDAKRPTLKPIGRLKNSAATDSGISTFHGCPGDIRE